MTYLTRDLTGEIKKWLDRKEIIAIKGPRQSGKTTLLKILRDYLIHENKISPSRIIYITFEDRDILETFTKDPKEYVRSYVIGNKSGRIYFLIDEFQYLKYGGQKLKLLYDLYDTIKYIVTGSSSLEISQHTAQYLVGRVFSFYLYQFSFAEFLQTKPQNIFNIYQEANAHLKNFVVSGQEFEIKEDIFLNDFVKYFEEFMLFGGYPEVIKSADLETKNIILKNIYDTYITKDIIELLRIKDIFGFRKVVNFLAGQIGNLLNYNSLANDSDTYFRQIKHYLSVLEETFLIRRLRPYFKNKTTELKKNPKLYFVDTGLRNYIMNNFNGFAIRNDVGSLVENVVLSAFHERWSDDLRYWRTLGQAEVDFILNLKGQIVPVEVKYSIFQTPKITRSLKNFIHAYKPAKAVVLTKGSWGKAKVEDTKVIFAPVWYAV